MSKHEQKSTSTRVYEVAVYVRMHATAYACVCTDKCSWMCVCMCTFGMYEMSGKSIRWLCDILADWVSLLLAHVQY